MFKVRNGVSVKDLGPGAIWAKQYFRVCHILTLGYNVWLEMGGWGEPDVLHESVVEDPGW